MVARNSPVSPPIVKSPMNPSAYSIGALYETDPRWSVAVQLKTLIADGIATRKLSSENIKLAYCDWPDTNIWWPHTRNPIIAIARLEKAMNLYPKISLRA